MTHDEAQQNVTNRFITAATGKPPTDTQRAALDAVITDVMQLAYTIELHTPAGRDKAIALTALEDVLMRANRSLFTAE